MTDSVKQVYAILYYLYMPRPEKSKGHLFSLDTCIYRNLWYGSVRQLLNFSFLYSK